MDGSFAAWLEERGRRGCLMDMVDDATGVTLAQMGEEETTWAAADCLRAWVEKYGIPAALYTDWKNVYLRAPTPKEQLQGQEPLTQFGRMCAKLGIRIIGASSPQAKGRCERKHGVHQDRLIKLLRLQGASSLEQVNQYLEQEYLREHNRRFAKAPAQPADFHRPVEPGLDLRPVFCLEEERVVSQDWVVRYQNRLLQLEPSRKRYLAAGSRVTVQEWRDGSLHVVYREREVAWKAIAGLPQKTPAAGTKLVVPPPRRGRKPAPEQPWRQMGVLARTGRRNGCRRRDEGSAVEMTGLWKRWKANSRLSTRSHSPLEISHTPRDSHISTARRRFCFLWGGIFLDGAVEKWKTKSRFSTFPPPEAQPGGCAPKWWKGTFLTR